MPLSWILSLQSTQFIFISSSRVLALGATYLIVSRPDGAVSSQHRFAIPIPLHSFSLSCVFVFVVSAIESLLDGAYPQIFGILGKFPLFSGSFCLLASL
jgi:hypothetical protein